jgi:hypothetical protein
MKKVSVVLFLAWIAVFSVNAAVPLVDTNAAALSPNLVDYGGWSASQFRSTIDTAGGFAILNPDSSVQEVKAHVTTTAANEATEIYPWVSIDCDLDSGKNFIGVTGIRITYKADKAWYMALYDSTLDPDNSGSYQTALPAAADFTTLYYNVLDTSTAYSKTVTFTQPDWVTGSAYRLPIHYDKINGFSFSPNDDAGTGVESTIELSDLRLYNYSGFPISVRHFPKSRNIVSGTIKLTPANMLRFSVPQTNTYTVSMYSPDGSLVAAVSKSCTNDGQNEIALKKYNLAPGLYVVNISQAHYSAIGKIVIK